MMLALLVGFFLSSAPNTALAQEDSLGTQEEIFEARITEIIREKEGTRDDGSKSYQQNIKLKGLEGEWKDKEFTFEGISEVDVVNVPRYQEGERVVVSASKGFEGNYHFYIIDYVRRWPLYLLALVFAAVIVIIGRLKGLRALIGLIFSFAVILKFIVPKIMSGSNPLLISISGGIIILLFIVYITQGFNKKSHCAVVSIVISLILTGLLSVLFTAFTKLTGMNEESMYLTELAGGALNLEGLLLAGILLGAVGVLDDIVIAQVSAVEQLVKANTELSRKEIFQRAMKVGVDHISSMTNTLFLAYAGASLPLLILFSIKQPPFLKFSQVINSEIIATEVVRTLVGSIGLALAVPITTFLAAYIYKSKKHAPTKKD